MNGFNILRPIIVFVAVTAASFAVVLWLEPQPPEAPPKGTSSRIVRSRQLTEAPPESTSSQVVRSTKSAKARKRVASVNPRAGLVPVPIPAFPPANKTPELAPVRDNGHNRLTQRSAALGAITILQIGDSHTAADFFTGTLRKILQARYGDGGPGYIIAGHPHIGVRSDTLKVSDTPGWTYKALQQSKNRARFVLAGFNAVADSGGRSMTFSAKRPLASDVWEVEAFRQPGGGAIDIRVDGVIERRERLDAPKVEPVVIRLNAKKNTRKLTVTTAGGGRVSLSSVALYNGEKGLTYNSVGFPGATINIVNKFDEQILASELRRIAPQIVVLSFGTNEGFNDNLDLNRYAWNYRLAVTRIRKALPNAKVVMIGPPDGGRAGGGSSGCPWPTPAKLNSVRAVQKELAKNLGAVYWDWSSIMPSQCGAHRWVMHSPPLMARDHVHFSKEGYRRSAKEFSKALIPIIDEIQASIHAVSNY